MPVVILTFTLKISVLARFPFCIIVHKGSEKSKTEHEPHSQ